MAAAKVSQVQKRHNARVKAMQALYQWDLNQSDIADIDKQFLETQDMRRVDLAYFNELLHGIPGMLDTLDASLQPCLDRPMENLDPIERAVCRIGAYELAERHDIPVRVVINECVEITKKFGADKGHHYVNGVIDKLARTSRALEIKAIKKT